MSGETIPIIEEDHDDFAVEGFRRHVFFEQARDGLKAWGSYMIMERNPDAVAEFVSVDRFMRAQTERPAPPFTLDNIEAYLRERGLVPIVTSTAISFRSLQREAVVTQAGESVSIASLEGWGFDEGESVGDAAPKGYGGVGIIRPNQRSYIEMKPYSTFIQERFRSTTPPPNAHARISAQMAQEQADMFEQFLLYSDGRETYKNLDSRSQAARNVIFPTGDQWVDRYRLLFLTRQQEAGFMHFSSTRDQQDNRSGLKFGDALNFLIQETDSQSIMYMDMGNLSRAHVKMFDQKSKKFENFVIGGEEAEAETAKRRTNVLSFCKKLR
jgi:hypothetical protein